MLFIFSLIFASAAFVAGVILKKRQNKLNTAAKPRTETSDLRRSREDDDSRTNYKIKETTVRLRIARIICNSLAGIFVFIAFLECFTIIPAGSVGIIDVFGQVSDNTLKAGINPVNPMAKIVVMSIKTQELKETMDVPSKEGLTVGLEVSALYHLNPEKAPEVYRTLGPDYASIILEPQFRSVSRGVTALYDAKALYTSGRETIAQLLMIDLEKIVEPRGIILESTPLRRVVLPPGLASSIEQKLQAEQESQRMEWVLTKEKQEAERKRIEGHGISDFQTIVKQGIDENLLKWKGIEATEKLAASNNTKIIVIGGGKDGLPIILNGDTPQK